MASVRNLRIMRDLNDFQRKEAVGLVLTDYADNLSTISVAVSGPLESPFEGGTFNITMTIPPNFPFGPPKMKFTTPVWHPNVSESGKICMDIVTSNWDSGTTLIDCADAARRLLNEANPSSPLNEAAADLFEFHHRLYNENAKVWTRIHAGGTQTSEELDEKLSVLTALGIEEEKALLTATENTWDMHAAVLACGI